MMAATQDGATGGGFLVGESSVIDSFPDELCETHFMDNDDYP